VPAIPARELEPRQRALADVLIEALDMATGQGRIELVVGRDGTLVEVYTHSRYGPGEPGEFDFAPAPG
jgi:hypothetical protein